ncbi:MAG: SUMF1/EgtB/PvdO family nonheme iron enzyme [Zoogloea sp.]|nr:SUMF1/EgtB/PvdO family nonheme iron enzyme [Zoogloea sp.]
MPNLLYPTRLASALAAALFSLPVCAAGLGGLNDEYTPPPAPVKPKPQVVEKIVEKRVRDHATEKRAQIAEAESKRKDVEIARLRALEDKNAQLQAELDKARKQSPKVVERVVKKPVVVPLQPSTPVLASDPAAACWKNGAWEAACGFAAYAGGPLFRVVGGNLNFTMGSPSTENGRYYWEAPRHQVSFQRRFALAETELTVAQYLACVDDGGCKEPEWREAGSQHHYQTGSGNLYTSRNAHQPDSPITGVSWDNAKAYVAWLSRKTGQTYTLPTEAQWEYAARGGQSGRWYFGDDESQLKDHAWYDANSGAKLHPVGSTRLSTHPWGLRDMAGNAREWVEDCWHDSYTNAPASGDTAWAGANGGSCGLRVLRGGSWEGFARFTRAADRYSVYSAVDRNYLVSFRPARMLP